MMFPVSSVQLTSFVNNSCALWYSEFQILNILGKVHLSHVMRKPDFAI